MGQNFTFRKNTLGLAFTAILMLVLQLSLVAQVTVTVTGTNITCFGANNGKATAVGGGGWPPYTYQWSTGATTANIAGLAPGVYAVTATDVDLGFAVGVVTITQPSQLGASAFSSSQICDVVPDGTATVVPFGGTPPYTYNWSNGGTTAIITGLAAGTYTVTVTDANACTAVTSTTVTWFGPEGIWISGMVTNVRCFGQGNGEISAMPMSGTPPYTYLWNTGATTMKITNLVAGTYTVTVTDANGCFGSHIFNVTQPNVLSSNIGTTPAACTNNGTATVTPTGGTGPYSIIWNNGQTNLTISSLAPGTYTVTVTDANGCSIPKTATVTGNNTGLTITGAVQVPAGCNIGGSATVSISSGSGNYTYLWSNGQTTAVATNLSVGNHFVTVTDVASGCTGVGAINMPQASPIITTVVVTTNATCSVGGSATANPTGGVPPYTYLWDTGATTQSVTNLTAGMHSVTVRDATGCVSSTNLTIGQTQGPTVTTQVNSNATCTAAGSATATATGGQTPYTYLWSTGQTTATASLPAGTHKVTVTDANGCAAIGMVTITQSGAPTASASVTQAATCLAGGKATVTATGGTAPYTYKWSNTLTTQTIVNLTAGTYTVTVTDVNGCTATASTTIVAPPVPTVVIASSSNANCTQPGSATAMAAGGSGAFTYKWSNGEMTAAAVNLPAGTYTVTVTDAGGCTATATATIGQTSNGITIGDYVWYDLSQDGFQNPTETQGVPNVSVQLIRPGPDGLFMTADDVVVTTTTTNANGIYQIACVTPGTYILMFSGIPVGYEFSPKDNVPNNCKDSDVASNGKTAPFTIVAGQGNDFCFDAGIHVICENVVNPGAICCDQTICEGDTPALLTESLPAIGGSGPIEYLWMEYIQVGQAPPTWMGIPGATGINYQPGPLFKTSFFMRCARRAGCSFFFETNIVTITVKPAGSPECGNFSQNLSVNTSGTSAVKIGWSTNAEFEPYTYTVQHSVNTTDWDNVGVVTGNMNAAEQQYAYTHETPLAGMNHYRLMRTTSGGVITYSESKSIELEIPESGAVLIYPNPVHNGALTVKNIAVFDADVTITITSPNGVVMHSRSIPKGSLQRIELDMESMPAGVYFAQVRFGNGDVKTFKLSKI